MISDVLLNSSNFSIYYKMINLSLLAKAKIFLNKDFNSNKRARIEEFKKLKFKLKANSFRR